MNIYVTRKENILVSESGFSLKDESDIGLLGRSHVFPMSIPDPETGDPSFGLMTRVEVFWETKRYPAPHFEDPNDLFWVSAEGVDSEDDSDEEDQEEIEEEEET